MNRLARPTVRRSARWCSRCIRPAAARGDARGLGLPPLPSVRACDPDGVRRGAGACEVMFVGEQPGDQEDVIGRPFVGPAGQCMDRAMEEAGIDRRTVYITNAVKHFKFEPRGKRRIHKTPEAAEIQACRFWLDVELVRLRPKLSGRDGRHGGARGPGRAVTITRERGRADRAAGRPHRVRDRAPVVPAADAG